MERQGSILLFRIRNYIKSRCEGSGPAKRKNIVRLSKIAVTVCLSVIVALTALLFGIFSLRNGALGVQAGPAASAASRPAGPSSSGVSGKKSGVIIRSSSGAVLNKKELKLKKGDTVALNAAVGKEKKASGTVAWSSSNTKVASVNSRGLLTAVDGGTASITAKSIDGGTAACKVNVSVPATGIFLNMTDIVLQTGETRSLNASVEPSDTTDKVQWSTSDARVVAVDRSGKIRAVAGGSAAVTAKAGAFSSACRVTVGTSIPELRLSENNLSLAKGDTYRLTAARGNRKPAVTWSSSSDSVASVDKTGKITAKSAGTAVITALDGKYSAQCTVKVTVPVAGISLSSKEISLEAGTTRTLTAKISPADATKPSIRWASSDKNVAAVDGKGNVTGIAPGTAVITAESGQHSAQCTVHVAVSVLTIRLSPERLALEKGASRTLTAIILPSDATEDRTIAWMSSNPAVASVDGFGKVTAKAGGTATITAKTSGGRFSATCAVTVMVPVREFSLNKTSLSLTVGKSETLIPFITPGDATVKDVFWDSSDSDVAAVDQSGRVTAVGAGTSTVTATTKDGSFTAACQVTVEPEAELSAAQQSSVPEKNDSRRENQAQLEQKENSEER